MKSLLSSALDAFSKRVSGCVKGSTDVFKVLLLADARDRLQGRDSAPLSAVPTDGMDIYRRHREMRMPFHFVPNCSRFISMPGRWDWLFGLFGHSVRSGGLVKMQAWENGSVNRHLFGMFLRMGKLRDAGRFGEFWKEAWDLMGTRGYQVACLNYVLDGWWKDRRFSEVEKVLDRVQELVSSRETSIVFRRVYIPKGSDSWRPLGVPTLAFRVYLHMLNNFVVWWRVGQEGSQHAYAPGRGVHTAWAEIFQNIDSPNVYEFDLTDFFGSVDLSRLCASMEARGFSSEACEFFNGLNQSLPKLEKEDRVEEPDRNVYLESDGSLNKNHSVADHMDMLYSDWNALADSMYDDPEGIGEVPTDYSVYKSSGVPQGAATSCGLSIIAIADITDRGSLRIRFCLDGVSVVMYADDGVIFLSDAEALPRVLELLSLSGASVNEKKSRWVKKDGKWLVPLKFCGIEFNGSTGKIRANTRSGSVTEFRQADQFLAHLLNSRELLLSGSASHLNNWKFWRGLTLDGWLRAESLSFSSLPYPQSLLFQGARQGWFLSRVFSDTRAARPDLSLNPVGGSWACQHWPAYRWLLLRGDPILLLRRLVDATLLEFSFALDLIKDKIDAYEIRPVKVAKCFRRWIRRLKHVERLTSLTRYFLSVPPKDWNLSLGQRRLLASSLELTHFNGSSFACHDLLSRGYVGRRKCYYPRSVRPAPAVRPDG